MLKNLYMRFSRSQKRVLAAKHDDHFWCKDVSTSPHNKHKLIDYIEHLGGDLPQEIQDKFAALKELEKKHGNWVAFEVVT